jgi:hypothetical protein
MEFDIDIQFSMDNHYFYDFVVISRILLVEHKTNFLGKKINCLVS